ATAFLAVAFFFTSIALTVLATRGGIGGGSAFDAVQQPAAASGSAPAPATTDAPALPNLGQPQQPAVPTNQ
ncbi:MAG: preprotein translocase subunit SecG, partial [Phyllobacteriaceae bacterium]|nr:preprotein translocase subunit SecG [Phyllobacteriaceae bacterium]